MSPVSCETCSNWSCIDHPEHRAGGRQLPLDQESHHLRQAQVPELEETPHQHRPRQEVQNGEVLMAYRKVQQQRDLAVQVYEYVLKNQAHECIVKNTELVDEIGADLACLIAAILKETSVEFGITRPITLILRQGFPHEHAVWSYIELVGYHTDELTTLVPERAGAEQELIAKPDAVARLLNARHRRRVRNGKDKGDRE